MKFTGWFIVRIRHDFTKDNKHLSFFTSSYTLKINIWIQGWKKPLGVFARWTLYNYVHSNFSNERKWMQTSMNAAMRKKKYNTFWSVGYNNGFSLLKFNHPRFPYSQKSNFTFSSKICCHCKTYVSFVTLVTCKSNYLIEMCAMYYVRLDDVTLLNNHRNVNHGKFRKLICYWINPTNWKLVPLAYFSTIKFSIFYEDK